MKNRTSTPKSATYAFAANTETAQAYGATVGELVKSLSSLSVPLPALDALQSDYVKQATELWNGMVGASSGEAPVPVALSDKRFADPSWTKNPSAAFMAQLYLLNARTLAKMADSIQGDEKTRERVRFAVQQWVAAAAPSNYLPLNPEAMELALKTQGESITQGLQHLVNDLRQGHMSQTDETVFEVGRNVATTEGAVVFENELFQYSKSKGGGISPFR